MGQDFIPHTKEMIQTKVLKIFEPRKDAITYGYRKLCNEELHKAYIIYSIKVKYKVHPRSGHEGSKGE
jgi:hypothetical protein